MGKSQSICDIPLDSVVANWIYVGQTKGRSRNDRYTTLKVPVKDIYLYPLTERFREALSHEA